MAFQIINNGIVQRAELGNCIMQMVAENEFFKKLHDEQATNLLNQTEFEVQKSQQDIKLKHAKTYKKSLDIITGAATGKMILKKKGHNSIQGILFRNVTSDFRNL